MTDLADYLRSRPYPGRGIVLGMSSAGDRAMIAYFLMGRSVNSRNRILESTEDGLRTRAYDPTKMSDPRLILYHPVRSAGEDIIITNGDQTDTIRDALQAGRSFQDALRTRTFEPDGPNWTPRISALLGKKGNYQLSILKSMDGDPSRCCRFFFEYDPPRPGTGHILHTYAGNGEPLPSFQGEPVEIALSAPDERELGELVWDSLNEDNKISLYTCSIHLKTGEQKTRIWNKLGGQEQS